MTSQNPPGVVAILIDPTGSVVANACDFDTSRPGGQPLLQAQKHRARRNLADAMAAAFCSPVVVPMMSSYAITSLLDEAVKHGFRIECIEVGHDAGEEE